MNYNVIMILMFLTVLSILLLSGSHASFNASYNANLTRLLYHLFFGNFTSI